MRVVGGGPLRGGAALLSGLLHDRIAVEHADRAAPIFFPRRPLRSVHQLGHELSQSGYTLFQGRFRPSAYPQNLFGHLSWACGSLSLGRGRGVRGFAPWHTPLKPLTLTLSQRERGYERMAKKVSCFCTRMSPVGRGHLLPGDSTDSWSLANRMS